jgi:hypothetical protein
MRVRHQCLVAAFLRPWGGRSTCYHAVARPSRNALRSSVARADELAGAKFNSTRVAPKPWKVPSLNRSRP